MLRPLPCCHGCCCCCCSRCRFGAHFSFSSFFPFVDHRCFFFMFFSSLRPSVLPPASFSPPFLLRFSSLPCCYLPSHTHTPASQVRLLARIRAAANKSSSSNNSSSSSSSGASSASASAAISSIEKTFAALLTPEGFRQRIFPGLQLPEGFEAPQTLREMLNDSRYDAALEAMMPSVVNKVDSVLNNVKKKAAVTGDVMDEETENKLRPQILLESFARELTKLIGRTSAQFMAQALKSVAPVAAPDDERAE